MLLNGIRIASLLSALLICLLTGNFQTPNCLWILPAGYIGTYVILTGLGFSFLLYLCHRVDLTVPQEHDDPLYRRWAGYFVDSAMSLLKTRLHTSGLHLIPKTGRFMVVCNHRDIMDPVIVTKYFKHSQLAFISKKENVDMFIIGKMMHKTMCQMIDRENNREGLKTILNCIRLLKEDECSIGAFPEGYITKDGKLHHFRSGIFKVAMKAKVPIVVCTIKGSENILKSAAHLKPVDCDFHVLGVISPEQYQGKTSIDISSHIFRMMLADLGPEYAPDEEPEEAAE